MAHLLDATSVIHVVMSQARLPHRGDSESIYVVVPTSAGLVFGRRLQESAVGRVLLETENGALAEFEPAGRVVPAADPAVFGPVSFAPTLSSDAASTLEALLALFRGEARSAEERREWAGQNGAADLPPGREIDELLKYRYEQYRQGWVTVLRQLLEKAVDGGDDRPLLATLEQSIPADARRVATDVAVAKRVLSAVPALCAAAIHRTQVAFARDAVRALTDLAPERLLLIARAAAEETRDTIDLGVAAALPESRVIRGVVEVQQPTLLNSDSAVPQALDPREPRSDVLLHLALSLPVRDQTRLLSADAASGDGRPVAHVVRDAVHALFATLTERESSSGYELLLRTAAAQFILADAAQGAPANIRTEAARTLVRDMEPTTLGELAIALPDRSIVVLVAAGLVSQRGDRTAPLLTALGEHRADLAPMLRTPLKEAVGKLEPLSPARLAALRLLAADEQSRGYVAQEAVRVLGRDTSPMAEGLAEALVRHEVVLDTARLRPEGRRRLLCALPAGSSRYAARVLRGLKTDTASESAWESINQLVVPKTWIVEDAGFRSALLDWIPEAASSGLSEHMSERLGTALAMDAPAAWASWSAPMRSAALRVIKAASLERAAAILAATAARLSPKDSLREALIDDLTRDVLSRSPATLAEVTSLLPVEELRLGLLQHGAELERLLGEHRDEENRSHAEAGRRLANDLQNEVTKALHAVGPGDQLGVLFTRLSQDIAEFIPSENDTDPDIAEYLEEFGDENKIHSNNPSRTEALLSALRSQGGRSRASNAARAFFRTQAERILRAMSREELEALVTEQRRVLHRLDLAAVEQITASLIQRGSDIALACELLATPDHRSTISVALRVAKTHPEAAASLISAADVSLTALAEFVAARATEMDEVTARGPLAPTGVVSLTRRLAPTFEALEGLLLNYMRLRRVLSTHGLTAVEPSLGNTRDARDLEPGTHRVMGLSIEDGAYEVQTQGFRLAVTGEVVVPATVAKRADPTEMSTSAVMATASQAPAT